MGFTNKQQVFINEYLICWNATEAARRAGYAYPNVEGPKNLVKPSIKAEINARMNALVMTADEALMRLSQQAKSDIGDFLTFEDGIKSPFIDLSKAQDKIHLIKKLKYTNNGLEFELYDKQAALVHIAKYHGLFTDKIELSGGLQVLIDEPN